MKWKLVEEKPLKTGSAKLIRLYRNEQSGSECETELIYTNDAGHKFWAFRDLYKIPYLRTAMAKHISDLFSVGLALSDITAWCKQEKDLINGNDPEKMQKLYALILEKETIATQTADPFKQHLALCTVYVLADDERIDHFTESMAGEKMILWKSDIDMTAFFLNWLNSRMAGYIRNLNKISAIVSTAKANRDQTKNIPQ